MSHYVHHIIGIIISYFYKYYMKSFFFEILCHIIYAIILIIIIILLDHYIIVLYRNITVSFDIEHCHYSYIISWYYCILSYYIISCYIISYHIISYCIMQYTVRWYNIHIYIIAALWGVQGYAARSTPASCRHASTIDSASVPCPCMTRCVHAFIVFFKGLPGASPWKLAKTCMFHYLLRNFWPNRLSNWISTQVRKVSLLVPGKSWCAQVVKEGTCVPDAKTYTVPLSERWMCRNT